MQLNLQESVIGTSMCCNLDGMFRVRVSGPNVCAAVTRTVCVTDLIIATRICNSLHRNQRSEVACTVILDGIFRVRVPGPNVCVEVIRTVCVTDLIAVVLQIIRVAS